MNHPNFPISGSDWHVKFVIKDMYNNQRIVETPYIDIDIVENTCNVSQQWDKSFIPPISKPNPIGIAADGTARFYLEIEKMYQQEVQYNL